MVTAVPMSSWMARICLGLGSAAGDRANDEERFFTFGNRGRERCVWRLERDVLFASEEAEEWAAFVGVVFADGAGEHRIAGFERVED